MAMEALEWLLVLRPVVIGGNNSVRVETVVLSRITLPSPTIRSPLNTSTAIEVLMRDTSSVKYDDDCVKCHVGGVYSTPLTLPHSNSTI